ncbi:hypothetical protein IGI72_003652 [Enterococcus sp. DIV1059_2]
MILFNFLLNLLFIFLPIVILFWTLIQKHNFEEMRKDFKQSYGNKVFGYDSYGKPYTLFQTNSPRIQTIKFVLLLSPCLLGMMYCTRMLFLNPSDVLDLILLLSYLGLSLCLYIFFMITDRETIITASQRNMRRLSVVYEFNIYLLLLETSILVAVNSEWLLKGVFK